MNSDPVGSSAVARLTRLEIRLHPTQVSLLDGMARRLTRERRRAGKVGRERLNKSALMRAAVAVLIEARGEIHGSTEAEIADSLKRWLAGGHAAPLPPATRAALRAARRQVEQLGELIDQAGEPPSHDDLGNADPPPATDPPVTASALVAGQAHQPAAGGDQ